MELKDFLAYPHILKIEPYDDGYVVSSPELIGLEVYGDTIKEALEEAQEAKITLYEMKYK